MATGQVIYTIKIYIVAFFLISNKLIEMYNITFTLEYNRNLISLYQIQEIGIIYYDNPQIITLIIE